MHFFFNTFQYEPNYKLTEISLFIFAQYVDVIHNIQRIVAL